MFFAISPPSSTQWLRAGRIYPLSSHSPCDESFVQYFGCCTGAGKELHLLESGAWVRVVIDFFRALFFHSFIPWIYRPRGMILIPPYFLLFVNWMRLFIGRAQCPFPIPPSKRLDWNVGPYFHVDAILLLARHPPYSSCVSLSFVKKSDIECV